ncbi:hypothetical protein OAZ20_06970, partial [Paracoccaceae bacterium]|nr:hypothetical protein [Paracoccaceae bacterium]
MKLISSINKKAFGKDSDRDLNRNLADAYEETFLPRAPNFTQDSGLNFYDDTSDPNFPAEPSRIIKNDVNYPEESDGANIFSNPR